ncbi:U3 small nucleolar RNA-associated protein 18 homolog [Papilio machaon]|uniref:U3 small nucleolar RNA-associated protein 18 homolog n=1 Tax=Papilio machaon TaxID=76193 RepID=UPI001E663A9F|nr:U3 small nucleolar RNA-associated protein 18 homolog [Papilio machaon]
MKRKISGIEAQESKLSSLLFNKSNKFTEKLSKKSDGLKDERKPAWFDEDDEQFIDNTVPPSSKEKSLYANKLKQKYNTLMGTPTWAELNKAENVEDDDKEILRTVGHLKKVKSIGLPKDFLEYKKFPTINRETSNEGAIIRCLEFHPKLSVSLVAGTSGVVSLFSIGGDVNTKLHSFKLKNWDVKAAHFTPDGTEAYIASSNNHNYCIYDLVKAEPKLIQLPKIVKRPNIFKLSSDGKYIATSIGLDEVYIICAKSKELLRSLKNNTNIASVAFSSTCDKLYCYGMEGEITVWDMSTFKALSKFHDQGCVTASKIETSACGRLLATGSGEGIVNVYEMSNLTSLYPIPLKTISHLKTKITNITFNGTSEILSISSGYYPNAIKILQLPSYHVFYNFPSNLNLYQVQKVSFSPNSGYMAIANNKGCAFLYRLKHYKNY